jgi:hypothetical protein
MNVVGFIGDLLVAKYNRGFLVIDDVSTKESLLGRKPIIIKWEDVISYCNNKSIPYNEQELVDGISIGETETNKTVGVTIDGKQCRFWFWNNKTRFWLEISSREFCLLHL